MDRKQSTLTVSHPALYFARSHPFLRGLMRSTDLVLRKETAETLRWEKEVNFYPRELMEGLDYPHSKKNENSAQPEAWKGSTNA